MRLKILQEKEKINTAYQIPWMILYYSKVFFIFSQILFVFPLTFSPCALKSFVWSGTQIRTETYFLSGKRKWVNAEKQYWLISIAMRRASYLWNANTKRLGFYSWNENTKRLLLIFLLQVSNDLVFIYVLQKPNNWSLFMDIKRLFT